LIAFICIYTQKNYSVDGNHTITRTNNEMTSSMSSIIHYHLLPYDINKRKSMEQDHEIVNDEYFSFSSSAPTINNINDFVDKSNR